MIGIFKLHKYRVIVEVIHSNIYILIKLKLHDSEHVCSEENIGLPDLVFQWRTTFFWGLEQHVGE